MIIHRLLPVIGIVLFLAIILNINLYQVAGILSYTNPLYIASALCILALLIVMKTIKWRVIAKTYGVKSGLKPMILGWLVGFSVGIVTPGRVGEISRAYYIRKDTPTGKAMTSIFIDRVVDIIVLLSLVAIGLSLFALTYVIDAIIIASFLLVYAIFIGFILFSLKKRLVRIVLGPIYRAFLPQRLKEKAGTIFNDYYEGLYQMKKNRGALVTALIWGVLIWVITIIEYGLLAMSIGIDAPFMFLVFVIPIMSLLDALPISFSGMGSRDLTFLLFFSYISVPPEEAIALSLLVFLVNYVALGFVGFLIWLKKPIKIKL